MKVLWRPHWRDILWCRICWTFFLAGESDLVEGLKNACFFGGDRGEPVACVRCPRCRKLIRICIRWDRARVIITENEQQRNKEKRS